MFGMTTEIRYLLAFVVWSDRAGGESDGDPMARPVFAGVATNKHN